MRRSSPPSLNTTRKFPMNPEDLFAARLAAADLSLFNSVPSQSTKGDRLSWLALQAAVRRGEGGYVYLEIGSHLGGSIQQHIVDPRCRRVFSIDKRPLIQPDDNRGACHYEGNSTARMMEYLRALAPDTAARVVTFDAETRGLDPAVIADAPNFCFIDGEHTQAAVLTDFAFCRRVSKPDAAIGFHDDFIVWPAIREIVLRLQAEGVAFVARKMDGGTFVILLGDGPATRDRGVLSLGQDGLAYLRARHRHALAVGWIPQRWRAAVGGWWKAVRPTAPKKSS
jgi:hypothetical protein